MTARSLAFTSIGIVLVASASAARNGGTFTPLGVPDLVPSDMSADGSRVVGQSYYAFGPNFLWTRDGGLVTLGGGCPSGRVAISGDGSTIVGCAVDAAGFWEASIWRGGTTWEGLGSVPGVDPCDHYVSGASALDQDGTHMVGWAWAADRCRTHAGVWDLEARTVADLGPGGPGLSGYPEALSRDGRVIVGAVFEGRLVAARWKDGVPEVLLDDLGRDLGQANAASADGTVIVGVGYPRSGAAWRSSPDRGVEPLGPGLALPHGLMPDWISWAEDVSDDGSVVVGFSQYGGLGRGWIWTTKGGFEWFDDFLAREHVSGAEGWQCRSVDVVSADGLVFAGTGTNPEGRTEGFVASMRAN